MLLPRILRQTLVLFLPAFSGSRHSLVWYQSLQSLSPCSHGLFLGVSVSSLLSLVRTLVIGLESFWIIQGGLISRSFT